MTKDLLEAAVKEEGVPRLVSNLGGEEDTLVLRGAACNTDARVSVTICSPRKNRVIVVLRVAWTGGGMLAQSRLCRSRSRSDNGPLLRLPTVVEGVPVVLRAVELVHLGFGRRRLGLCSQAG